MARVTDKGQLKSWLARVFPPSSPDYLQPAEIPPVMHLVVPALPPSLVYERMGFQLGVTVNPATQLFFPSVEGGLEAFGATQLGVPFGKYYWVAAARWEQQTQVPTTAGRAWIGLKAVQGIPREFAMAAGFFSALAASFSTDFVDTHSPNVTAAGVACGGGGGPFVVPPGYTVHFSTAAAPAAATTFVAGIHYCVLDIGELHPNI